MRISSFMMQQMSLRHLQGNLQTLSQAEIEAATGRRIRTMSDDPVDAATVMRLDAQIRDVAAFRRNAATATTRLSAEDTVLETIRELLDTAVEIAAGIVSDDPLDPKRQSAIAEIDQIRQQVVSLGNTRIGNEYIFGGAQSTTAPFLPDGTYVGDGTVRQAAIDSGVTLDTNATGDQELATTLTALDGLFTQLQTGTAAGVAGTVGSLTGARNAVLTRQTVIGARLRMIDDTSTMLARRTNDLLDRQQAVRDVEPGEALLKVMHAQQSLERAYASIGRVMQTSLIDYLR